VLVYARPKVGINLQRGWRGPEKGRIFKFEVWFADSEQDAPHKRTEKFDGYLQVEGLDISPGTTFNAMWPELEKKGYQITE
jgi:hypothetical protein